MEGEGQEKAQRSVQDDKKAKLLKDAIDSWVMKLTDGSGNNRLLYYKTLKVGTLNTKGAESSKLQKLQNGEKVLVSELFKPEKSNQRTLTKDALSSDSQYALLGLIQFFERESHTNVPVGHKERIEKSDPMKVATSGGRNLSELIEVLESEVAGRKLDDGLAEELKMLGINHLVDVDKHLKSVSNIYKRAKSYFEEKGVSILYVTKDFVTWEKDPTKKAVPNAPLLLAPLEITPVGSGQTDFYLKITDDWQINETLILHLEKKYGSVISLEQLEGINNGENLNLDQQSQKAFSLLEKTFGNQFQKKSSSIIGTFTYTKFPMVKDLENGLEWLLENDLVAAIAGDNESKEQVREENAPNEIGLHDPNHLPPKNEFLILDADSSQNFAINAALSGKSLVVHGPPGTGKSQTIANLISASVANRKSVLFVAEKRAAIEAVQKRLEQSGLGDVIFDLHLKKLKKSDHVSQLRNSSLRPKNQDTLFGHQEPQDYSETQQELERLRKKLIDYEHALHKVREPWGISRYEVGEQQLKFDSVESFRFKIPIHEIGDIKKVAESVHDWVEKSKVMSLESLWVRSAVNAKNRDSLLETVEKIEEVLHSQLLPLLKDLEKISTASNLKELPISQIMDLPNFSSDVEKIHEYFDPKIWNKALIARALKAEGTKELNGLMRRGIYLRLFAKRRKELLNEAGSLLDQWRKTYGMEAIPTEVFNHPKLIEIMNGLKSDISLLGKDVMETLNQSSVTRALNSAILMIDEKDITQSLLRFQKSESALINDYQLKEFVNLVKIGEIDLAVAQQTFLKRFYELVASEIDYQDEVLSDFDALRHQEDVDNFIEGDKFHLSGTAQRVMDLIGISTVAKQNEYPQKDQIVKQEMNKKTRYKPLRKLMDEASEVISAAKPCWMMSPLLVSQILPQKRVFDLVIFDEASQIKPEDAIGAIGRGRQLVVAGDHLQLPPSNFFNTDMSSEEEEDSDDALLEGYESILDICRSLLPERMLQWHYRSRDERLISLSNEHIYHNSLTTFPGNIGQSPIHFVKVDHVARHSGEAKSNPTEVAKVVDLMFKHAKETPDRSLGIIAFGVHHANQIEEEKFKRLRETNDQRCKDFFDDTDKAEYCFVKNLETVQGDERDSIILSIGYGKDTDGQIKQRWGPINQNGGERRINVAATRARSKMTIVSSMSEGELPNDLKNPGPKLLKSLLAFAASGGNQKAGSNLPKLNFFELRVKEELEKLGLRPIAQYGVGNFLIDFVIPDPQDENQLVLAVEADGASYHSQPTARERDRLRQQILEDKGWIFHRIWSHDFFKNPEQEALKVLEAFQNAKLKKKKNLKNPTQWRTKDAHYIKKKPPTRAKQEINKVPLSYLVRLANYYTKDGLAPVDDYTLKQLMRKDLGYAHMGARINEKLQEAINVTRGEVAPPPKPKTSPATRKKATTKKSKTKTTSKRPPSPYCSKCTGRMVRRKGKYGYFQGCSNYPRCRYTRNL